MTKTPVAILVLGLLAAAPAWSQTLTKDAEVALNSALQDERHAEAFYESVLNKFSGARPFSNIIEAERQHQTMLLGLYETYGLAVPSNDYSTDAKAAPAAPETLSDACKIGVEAEIANRDLYDKQLLPAVAAYPDIILVLQRLRDASEEKHLPAFQRCLTRG